MTSEARTGEEPPKKKTKKARPAGTEATPRTARKAEAPATPAPVRERTAEEIADDERKLGTSVAVAIPVLTVFAASVLGVVASAGPALLVLGAGILLGTIALFWASLRTLTGDAPLAEALEHASFSTTTDAMVERKRMLLRALKDLESELAVGKIDAKDYAVLSDRFRKEIKDLMREMDDSIEPHVKKAEELVQKHFSKIGLSGEPFRNPGKASQAKPRALDVDDALPAEEDASKEQTEAKTIDDGKIRVSCVSCGASNEPDARFCKGCGGALDGALVKSTKVEDTSEADDEDESEEDEDEDEDDESDESADDSSDEAPAKAEGGKAEDQEDGEDSGEEPEKKTSGSAKNA